MTAADFGGTAELFVTNVLNGTVAANGATVDHGTVVRLFLILPSHGLPYIFRADTIGSGFAEHLDPAALVIGPTGVGLAPNGTLYVADTVANRIAAIPGAQWRLTDAGTGYTVSQGHHLNGELGLVVAPGGDILTVNSGDGNLVEVTPSGFQIAVRTLDSSGSPAGAGALFGLVVKPGHRAVYFVDDATNTLDLLH
jgi:DNA-binding beta-propeller fold protein YncE